MNFIPEQPKEAQSVPYFEDATSADGWQGQSTTKSVKALQSEIREAISYLGGEIISFQSGRFDEIDREGFLIRYVMVSPDGRELPGRINIAALPLRAFSPRKHDQTLRMALYMVHLALKGVWFLQQLSPGFSALVPFMMGPGNKTISELWAEGPMNNLLPPGGDDDFIEGEGREI